MSDKRCADCKYFDGMSCEAVQDSEIAEVSGMYGYEADLRILKPDEHYCSMWKCKEADDNGL